MTVNELIAVLQKLAAEGRGETEVCAVDTAGMALIDTFTVHYRPEYDAVVIEE